MRMIVAGGNGGRSGVPTYLSYIYTAFNKTFDLYFMSDINEGGYDFVAESGKYYEITGLGSGSGVWKKISAFVECVKVLRAVRPEVVWANSSFTVVFLRVLRVFFGYRLIVTYHGVPYGPGRGVLRSVSSFIIDYFSVFFSLEVSIVISDKDRKLLRFSGPFAEKLLIPNPVLSECIVVKTSHVSSSRYRLVMTSRDSYQKNIDKAVSIVASNSVLELDIFGDVSPDRQLYLEALGGGRVRCLGVSNEVGKLLPDYDCYLMTSRYEGLPIGAIEAQCSGLALAMTDVGGLEEFQDVNRFCVVLDLKQPNAILAEHVASLVCAYRADAQSYSEISSLASQQFSFVNWTDRVKGVIDNT